MDLVSLYEICRRYDLEVSFRYNPSTEALIINIDDTKFGIRRRWSGEITKEEIYSSGNKNTAIDSLNYEQIQGYFVKKDSANVMGLLKELDSLKVKLVKVKNLSINTEINGKDTLDYANYTVEYKDRDQRMIGEFNKKSQYKLLKSPVNFKKEFKFYFVEIDVKPKDSTSVGVTK